MKTSRRQPGAEPERLTTAELIAAHERVFGPLTPQAKARILSIAAGRIANTRDGRDSLAA